MDNETLRAVKQEAFAAGYSKAQSDAAHLFGAVAYEQANRQMMDNVETEEREADALLAAHSDRTEQLRAWRGGAR
jgi:hypothetical protein